MKDFDTSSIALTHDEIDKIITIFHKHLGKGANIRIFGSRVNGTNRKYSDVDVAVISEKVTFDVMCAIKSEFSESDFPYKIDIVDYHDCDADFKKIIDDSGIDIM